MSVFYLLPPRTVLGDRLARFLQPLLPGIDWDSRTRIGLAETIGARAAEQENVYVVYRDEFPTGTPAAQGLTEGFGAESGDEVIEVRFGLHADEWSSARWRIV